MAFIIFNSLIAYDNKEDTYPYEGLKIEVDDAHYQMLYKMYNDSLINKIYTTAKIQFTKKDRMFESLQKNFVNMVNSFRANQGNLPRCVQDAFNKFLNEIKTPYQNGKPRATIEWKIYDDRPGRGSYDRSKYNKDYDDLYFQVITY